MTPYSVMPEHYTRAQRFAWYRRRAAWRRLVIMQLALLFLAMRDAETVDAEVVER